MKLKTVEINGKHYAETDGNGHPVYVHNDGKEAGFDAPAANGKLATLNHEAMTRRQEFEALEGRFAPFKDLKPEEVADAMKVRSNLSAGELKTAAQVEEIKAAAQKAADEKVAATAAQMSNELNKLKEDKEKLQASFYNEKLGNAFATSGYVKEKTVIPPEMLQSMFGKNFKFEDGNLVPYDGNNNKLFSKTRGGELANFDEALESIIDGYAHKGSVLKGTGHSGGGAQPPAGGGHQGSGGKPTMTRQQYEALPAGSKRDAATTHQIVDAAA